MGLKLTLKFLLLASLLYVVQWHALAKQLLAPAWPLAVKNPYLNTYYSSGSNPLSLNAVWPNLWNGTITGWFCGVQIDGVPYAIMGDDFAWPRDSSTQLSVQITPTQTIVQVKTGPVNITMNFLSPITVRSDYTSRHSSLFNSLSCRLPI